jgi:hypothetical protein
MRYILSILLIFPAFAIGQYKSYIIGVKGDTLNVVDMQDKKQGRWVIRVDNLRGEPGYEEEGIFKDGKKEGTWRKYQLTGDLSSMENYKWGFRDGKQYYFTTMGDLEREESWKARNPDNPYDTVEVPDLYNPMKTELKVIKLEGAELRHGEWKYYDASTGFIKKTERYFLGELEGKGNKAQTNSSDTAVVKKATPKPAAVLEYEKKNAGKKKIQVRDGRTGG